MKWLFVLLSVFIFFSITICFTHTGNVFLWESAKYWLPKLKGEMTEGHLGKGWVIQNIEWKDINIEFNAEKITIAWNPLSLLRAHLIISHIECIKPKITLADNNTKIEYHGESLEKSPFSTPLPVSINNINITTGEFINTNININFNNISTSLELNDNDLIICPSFIQNLKIKTIETLPKRPTNYKATLEQLPIKLPTINFPLSIKIQEIKLSDSDYNDEIISSISLSCKAKKNTITLYHLKIDHSLASAHLSGDISLKNNFPLDLKINATLKKNLIKTSLDSQKTAINATLTGSISELHTTITTQGLVNATVTSVISPTKPRLPFEMHLIWEQLQWPLAVSEPNIRTKKGEFKINGNITEYKFDLASTVITKDNKHLDITVEGKGDKQHLTIYNSKCETTKGSASLEGNLSWNKNIQWEGHTNLKNLNPSLWISKLPGQLNGKITHYFSYDNKQWNLDIKDILIKGHLRSYPAKVSGSVKINNNMYFSLNNLSIIFGNNTITANGDLNEYWNLITTIDAPDLKQLYPELTGSIKGKTHITGNPQNHSANYTIEIPALSWQNISFTNLHSEGSLKKSTEYEGNITFRLQNLQSDSLILQNLQINASGLESDHSFTLSSQGIPIAADIALTGSWKNTKWQGSLKQAHIKTHAANWVLKQPLPIILDSEKNIFLPNQCWQSNNAELSIKSSIISKRQGDVKFSLKQFDLNTLKQIYPKHAQWHAKLSGKGRVQWANNQPKLFIELATTPGIIETKTQQHKYDIFNAHIDINEKKLDFKLLFQSKESGKIGIELSIDDIRSKRLLSGKLNIQEFMLKVMTPFIPKTKNIKGTLSAKGSLTGSLTKPLFYGNLNLNDGGVQVNQEIVKIQNLNTKMKINGDSALISGKMSSGKENINFGGNLNWKKLPPTGKITIKGNNLEIQYPGVGKIQIHPDIVYTIGNTQRVTGSISIPWARIRINGLPNDAVARSKDVVIIKPEKNVDYKTETTAPMNLDIKLVVGNDVHLDAFDLKTNLEGSIEVLHTPKNTIEVNGSIKLKDSIYHSFGQSLIIKKGKIIFSGPINNPFLILEAIRSPDTIDDNTIVGVLVNGPIYHPECKIFSNPSMPQNQQLSYLLRGRALKSTKGDDQALQMMLLQLGFNSIGGVIQNIGKYVGLKDANLDTVGSSDETQAAISGYISPSTKIQYGIGVFNSIGEVKIKHELMPKLYLQAVNGLDQALDIFYQFSL